MVVVKGRIGRSCKLHDLKGLRCPERREGKYPERAPPRPDHYTLLNAVLGEAHRAGLRERDSVIFLTRRDGFVTHGCKLSGMDGLPAGGLPTFGLTSATISRRQLTFYTGFATPDTAVVLDYLRGPRYDHGFHLDATAVRAVSWWVDFQRNHLNDRIRRLTDTPVTDAQAEIIGYKAGQGGVLPWSRVGHLERLWARCGDRTAWGLCACAWTQIRRCPTDDQLAIGLRLQYILENVLWTPDNSTGELTPSVTTSN